MATLDNIMDYLANIAPPTFDTITEVYNRTGKYDDTFTVPTTGWYIIECYGFWNSTTVKINNKNIAIAQVTTSNIAGANASMYLLRAGLVLALKTGETGGNITIRHIQ